MTTARTPVDGIVGAMVAGFPDEAARWLEREPADDVAAFFTARPGADCAPVFERLTATTASRVLEAAPPRTARELLVAVAPAVAATCLHRVSREARGRLLDDLDPGHRRELEETMSYTPDTAGALMDTDVVTLRPDQTAADALDRLRNATSKSRHEIYLVAAEGRLAGRVSVLDLAVADPGARLDSLAADVPVTVQAIAPREEVVADLERHRLTALPVVDFHQRLIGVIRHAALVGATREEYSVGLQTMVGVGKDETALSPVSFAVRKRLPWLNVNLLTAFLAASVVGLFESTIATFTALAVLLPVVAGQSGNTGAQALAVTLRGLALREIRPRQWMRVTTKELGVSVVNGIAIAVVTALGVFFWSRSLGLAAVIFLAMIISMTAAGLAGAAIPMLLTSLRQDPAQSSSIILTTVTDVVGFFSFLGIATLLASYL